MFSRGIKNFSKKFLLDIFLIIAVLISIFSLFYKIIFFNFSFSEKEVCIKNNCFYVKVADTGEKRRKGLMGIKNLKEKEGMIFIFEKEDIYPFWMKNTLIPLDIIWINQGKEVVFISENTQPCFEKNCPLIFPQRKAKYVLEIKGGLSKALKIQEGDQVIIE